MDIRKLQRAIVDGLEDVKAQDIVVFNTEHLSPLFERVIIASGTSNRQTKALAASVRDAVKSRGLQVLRTEGEAHGEWIIVDCGAAVAHIMQPTIREYYRLEEIWGDKPVSLKRGSAGPSRLPKAEVAPEVLTPAKGAAAKKAAAKKTVAKKAAAKKVTARKVASGTSGGAMSAVRGDAPSVTRRAGAAGKAAAPAGRSAVSASDRPRSRAPSAAPAPTEVRALASKRAAKPQAANPPAKKAAVRASGKAPVKAPAKVPVKTSMNAPLKAPVKAASPARPAAAGRASSKSAAAKTPSVRVRSGSVKASAASKPAAPPVARKRSTRAG